MVKLREHTKWKIKRIENNSSENELSTAVDGWMLTMMIMSLQHTKYGWMNDDDESTARVRCCAIRLIKKFNEFSSSFLPAFFFSLCLLLESIQFCLIKFLRMISRCLSTCKVTTPKQDFNRSRPAAIFDSLHSLNLIHLLYSILLLQFHKVLARFQARCVCFFSFE